MRVLWSQACFHSICFNGSEPVSVYVCSVCRGGGGNWLEAGMLQSLQTKILAYL